VAQGGSAYLFLVWAAATLLVLITRFTDLCMASRLQRLIVGKKIIPLRSDIAAAIRGGDTEQGMETEADPLTGSLEQAFYWQKIYGEIVVMEEGVLARIYELMADQGPEARREVELSNVPVVVAQLARFKQRRGYWDKRIQELWQRQRSIRPDASEDNRRSPRGNKGQTLKGVRGASVIDGGA
jgi:hypothetical protein